MRFPLVALFQSTEHDLHIYVSDMTQRPKLALCKQINLLPSDFCYVAMLVLSVQPAKCMLHI